MIYSNASPAVGVVLVDSQDRLSIIERAIDPGKGRLDIPGGFCYGTETLEAAIARELTEEVGISPDQYSTPEFILSEIDIYHYEGETLPVVGVMFRAKLVPGIKPKAGDDAASAQFIYPKDIDLSKVQFLSVRKALERTKQL
ncbi:MAG TPA: NUDIX domain-containing protein [Candidatus Saccharimonadales bacterium]